jgi:hypothetical protein
MVSGPNAIICGRAALAAYDQRIRARVRNWEYREDRRPRPIALHRLAGAIARFAFSDRPTHRGRCCAPHSRRLAEPPIGLRRSQADRSDGRPARGYPLIISPLKSAKEKSGCEAARRPVRSGTSAPNSERRRQLSSYKAAPAHSKKMMIFQSIIAKLILLG